METITFIESHGKLSTLMFVPEATQQLPSMTTPPPCFTARLGAGGGGSLPCGLHLVVHKQWSGPRPHRALFCFQRVLSVKTSVNISPFFFWAFIWFHEVIFFLFSHLDSPHSYRLLRKTYKPYYVVWLCNARRLISIQSCLNFQFSFSSLPFTQTLDGSIVNTSLHDCWRTCGCSRGGQFDPQ